ncbi:MAG: 2-C-methyl-D-erythritol 4-phosphate cytidylyltransferase [Gemmataceae bacterium]
MPQFAVILPAAGKSSRFRDKEKKPFANLEGRAVWLRTAEYFVARDEVIQTILIVSREDEELVRRRYGANLAFLNVQIALGGTERFESVANALALVKTEAELVAIHDAVRPCITEELVTAVFNKAAQTGAAILAVPVADTLKNVNAQRQIESTLPREGVWQAQTPQVFRREWLVEAYANGAKFGNAITDDAQLIEASGHRVHIVEGTPLNVKITTKQDLILAEAVLKARPKPHVPRAAHPFAEEEMWGKQGKK